MTLIVSIEEVGRAILRNGFARTGRAGVCGSGGMDEAGRWSRTRIQPLRDRHRHEGCHRVHRAGPLVGVATTDTPRLWRRVRVHRRLTHKNRADELHIDGGVRWMSRIVKISEGLLDLRV